MTDETNIETQETASVTREPGKPRKRWRYLDGVAIVRDTNGAETSYSIASLPAETISRLAFDGVVVRLSRGDDAEAAWAKIVAGDFPATSVAAPKEVSPWRKAIAMVRMDAKKKSGSPVTLDEAQAWANDLDAKVVRAYKTDIAVVKHYNKLVGVETPSFAD